MDRTTGPAENAILRLAKFPLVFLVILYGVLTYLHLAGFFFRTTFTHGIGAGLAAALMDCAMMLCAYAGLVFVIEGRAVSELALRPLPREYATGLLLGFGLYSLCILALYAVGAYRIEGFGPALVLLSGLAGPLATGVFEELFFRGGIFRVAEKYGGTWIALVISSLVFGFVHLENDAATMRGILSISLWAGVLLAATYVLTRRLWLGIGLHAAWNYTQGSVYSGIVSGSDAPITGVVKSSMQGPDWLTGGSFGVEASIVAVVICSAAGMIMMIMAARRGHIMRPVWAR